jgi:hypothetical protein
MPHGKRSDPKEAHFMPIAKDLVDELCDKCGLPAKDCRAALTASGGDVDAALAALIDAGRVKPDDLNPESVSDELFERAARRQKLAFYEQFAKPGGGLLGMLAKMGNDKKDNAAGGLADTLAQLQSSVFGNKTAEELMAEDEAKEAARLKQVYKTMPGLKGKKPMTPGEQARLMARTTRRSAWLKSNPFTLELPPFPPLKREMHEWTGRDVLPAWAGTQERHGAYTSRSSGKASKGSVVLNIPRLDENDEHPLPPAPEQIAAYAYFKENQAEVTQAIMAVLLKDYTKTRRQWLKHDPELELPEIKAAEEMRKHVGLGTLHMFDVAQKGLAYFGLELGCTWDEEHGAGVVVHGDRVIAVGQADTSFTPDYAIEDGGVKIGRKSKTRKQNSESRGKKK